MNGESIRRSKRLLLKRSAEKSKNRCSRRLTKSPSIAIVSDNDEGDDDDVIYIEPEPPTMIDLTKPTHQIISKQVVNNETSLPSPEQFSCREESLSELPHQTPSKRRSGHAKDDLATPPKQRKAANDENTPAVSPSTPVVLLERLSLVGSEEKKSQRKLFAEKGVYQSARKALHSTYPTSMPGREKELHDLKDFILRHLHDGSSATLYVSGPPGTGKTASLNLILQEETVSSELKDIYINCTSIKSSSSVFSKISKELGVKTNGKGEKGCMNAIETYLKVNHKPVLLVLDEIDQLESKNQSVLYTIFEWSSNPNLKLILIGISNALDLTDRILPRLQARCELKPKLMHFAPYTKQQIVEIFTNRLKSAGVLDIFSPVAIQMLAGKVAAVSGDVRRALDIGRRVVELVDRKKSGENMLKSIENLAEELGVAKTVQKMETVDLKQVINVLNNVYGTSQHLSDDIDDSFPLQQKIVVCSLLLILKKAKNKDVTIGRLHDIYRKVCLKRNIQVVDQGEFVSLCSLIETRGIMKIIKKKDPRLNKISLMWDEEEVAEALKDKQLMSMILQDDECLGKL